MKALYFVYIFCHWTKIQIIFENEVVRDERNLQKTSDDKTKKEMFAKGDRGNECYRNCSKHRHDIISQTDDIVRLSMKMTHPILCFPFFVDKRTVVLVLKKFHTLIHCCFFSGATSIFFFSRVVMKDRATTQFCIRRPRWYLFFSAPSYFLVSLLLQLRISNPSGIVRVHGVIMVVSAVRDIHLPRWVASVNFVSTRLAPSWAHGSAMTCF